MGKDTKILAAAGAVCLLIGGLLGWNFYQASRPYFELTQESITAELGSKPDLIEYITAVRNAEAEDILISSDYKDKVGSYTANYSLDKVECSLAIRVEDTTAPVLKAEDLQMMTGGFADLKAQVYAEDLSPVSVEISGDIPDFSTSGVYTVTAEAIDEYGNASSCDFTVTVKDPLWDVKGINGQPYLVAVNRVHNTVTVYEKDEVGSYTKPLKAMVCSVGKAGHETIPGRFDTEGRYEWCYMVDGSYGRYAIRIYKGIMFHSVCYFSKSIDNLEYEEFNKLGEAASLGCIRLCVSDVKWLYDNCPNGFPCVIYDDETTPGPLGKPETVKIDINDEIRRGWDPTDPEKPW